MARQRSHSIEFKRQVAQEFIAGESLYALSKRHDISRQLIRVWVQRYEAGALDEDAQAADRIISVASLKSLGHDARLMPAKYVRPYSKGQKNDFRDAEAIAGIDIGKNSFHVVGLDQRGAIALRQRWSRGQVEARFANMLPCLIGMEACVGATVIAVLSF